MKTFNIICWDKESDEVETIKTFDYKYNSSIKKEKFWSINNLDITLIKEGNDIDVYIANSEDIYMKIPKVDAINIKTYVTPIQHTNTSELGIEVILYRGTEIISHFKKKLN